MVNPATLGDVESRWRPIAESEQDSVWSLMCDAWALLRGRVPGLDARLGNGVLSEELVIAVECAMVLRVLRNPDGKRSETIDDYTWVRDNAVSAGMLYITADEVATLSPSSTTAAFTIRPAGTDPCVPAVMAPWYCP